MTIITIHMRKNDGLEKKIFFFLYFHIREVLSHSRECGRRAAFPGGSRMIREGSHVWLPSYFTFKYMDRVKRICYLSPMWAAKVQASLRMRAVSPEPSLLAHTSSESRGTFRQKARFLAPLNDWACAVKICHDGMLEDTNSLDGALVIL